MQILKVILSATVFFLSSGLLAQSNTYNQNGHVKTPTPIDGHAFVQYNDYDGRILEYPFVREDDILWSNTYIQKVDLRQKKNHPYYFPLYPVKVGSGNVRMSFSDVLLKAVVEDQTLTAYTDEYFDEVKTIDKINKMLFSIDTVEFEDIDSGELVQEIDTIRVEAKDIKEFLILEDRFFDKKRSVIDVRILGVCLVAETLNAETFQMEKQKLFWVWYPNARQTLANSMVHNTNNSMERLTFDEMFQKRLFSSIITKESNLYDRSILDYKKDKMQQILEADRIKNDIRNLEIDLWEY
jgi:gliding motility associated protien GldN